MKKRSVSHYRLLHELHTIHYLEIPDALNASIHTCPVLGEQMGVEIVNQARSIHVVAHMYTDGQGAGLIGIQPATLRGMHRGVRCCGVGCLSGRVWRAAWSRSSVWTV
jgi:hypothetical protein